MAPSRRYRQQQEEERRERRHQAKINPKRPARPDFSSPNLPAAEHLPNSSSINQLKSKIRDTTRALTHSTNIPPGVRIEKERALASYKHDLSLATESKQQSSKMNAMISKYHKVRFVERQKATRALKKAKARLAAAAEAGATEVELNDSQQKDTAPLVLLRQQVHDAEVDYNYTLYYPLDRKYVSLWPPHKPAADGSGEVRCSTTSSREEKDQMWKMVESCLENGTLAQLRSGALTREASKGNRRMEERVGAESVTPTTGRSVKVGETAETTDPGASPGGDESDGNFFE